MKEKNIFGSEKIIKKYKQLNRSEKDILWVFLGSIILAICLMGLISTLRSYNSDISPQECNQLRANDVRYYLGLQEENNILAFIYSFQLIFKLLIGAIGVAWILHGVGFHIIKE